MSLKAILKNVYNYVDILQTACSDKVKGWDSQALDNALQWAQYCQQIYIQAEGKPYENELDQHIRHIGQLPWAIGNRKISLYAIKHAVTTLKQALLSNPHLSKATYEHLISSYGQIQKTPELLIKDLMPLKHVRYSNDLAPVFLSTVCGSDILWTKCCVQYSAKLLLEHADMLLHQKPSRKQQCKDMLMEKLDYIGTDKEGLEIICLACSVPCINKEISQKFLMTWLLQEPQCKHVFELSSDVLAEVCLVHFIFFRAYIKYLLDLTSQAECNVQENGMISYRKNVDINLYKVFSKLHKILIDESLPGNHDFTTVLHCVSSLTRVGEPVTSAMVKTVESLSKSDNTGLWRKLLGRLQTQMKNIKECKGIG